MADIQIQGPYAVFFIAAQTIEQLAALKELAAENGFEDLEQWAKKNKLDPASMWRAFDATLQKQGVLKMEPSGSSEDPGPDDENTNLDTIRKLATEGYAFTGVAGFNAAPDVVAAFLNASMARFDGQQLQYKNSWNEEAGWNRYGIVAIT